MCSAATHGIKFFIREITASAICNDGREPDVTICAIIERYIDAPAKDGNGCGGKLVRWWPGYIRRWQDDLSWQLRYGRDRAAMWAQWGPERHAEMWAAHDARIAAAEAQMWAEGIDPNEVGKPSHHKGAWPVIAPVEELRGGVT